MIETRAAGGWDVLEEQDRRVVREVHYDDWHRVERQLNVFAMRVEILKNEGLGAGRRRLRRHHGAARAARRQRPASAGVIRLPLLSRPHSTKR